MTEALQKAPKEQLQAALSYTLNALRMLEWEHSASAAPQGGMPVPLHRIKHILNTAELVTEFGLTDTLQRIIDREAARYTKESRADE